MTEHFLCKVEGWFGGDSGDLKEARLPSRIIRRTPSGLKYESDPRHAEQLGATCFSRIRVLQRARAFGHRRWGWLTTL
eukprot:2177254-Alexandrium_andersonii.AAC.1